MQDRGVRVSVACSGIVLPSPLVTSLVSDSATPSNAIFNTTQHYTCYPILNTTQHYSGHNILNTTQHFYTVVIPHFTLHNTTPLKFCQTNNYNYIIATQPFTLHNTMLLWLYCILNITNLLCLCHS